MLKMPSHFPVACHTSNITQGSTFVVIQGQKEDGIRYISQALAQGAHAIVIEEHIELPQFIMDEITTHHAQIIRVKNTRKALAELSAKATDFPARKLKIIGITGTKGKSTTTHLTYHLLKAAGASVACLSTVHNLINDTVFSAPLTTAQPDYLHQFLKLCVEQKVEYVVMEVAAQAFTFNRVDGIAFDAFVFTNLEREHGELYPTLEGYFDTKCALFNHLKKNAPVIINYDDEYGKRIMEQYPSYTLEPFSFKNHLNKNIPHASYHHSEQNFSCIQWNTHTFFYQNFAGIFNAYNVLSALKILTHFDILNTIKTNQENPFCFPSLPGRCEQYQLPNGAHAIIDYAHTPQSFNAILSTMRKITPHLIVIFGAGGGKDHAKRPLMGTIASTLADLVIITSDNPRHEDPLVIANMIQNGVGDQNKHKIIIELNRQKAIERAYQHAQSSSYIMLLGKGPDEYEIVGNTKLPFSERAILHSL